MESLTTQVLVLAQTFREPSWSPRSLMPSVLERSPLAPTVRLVGLCDVNNPLLGPDGASVFAVQKGATPKAQATLVAGAPWVLDRVGFDAQLAGAAALVVGEGRFDATSLTGKLTGEAISRARHRSDA